jgi:hypothetical protein
LHLHMICCCLWIIFCAYFTWIWFL